MRISTSWLYTTTSSTLQSMQQALSHTQQQLATGERLLAPSDDPVASARILDISSAMARNEQYQRNSNYVQNRLGLEEQALADTTRVLQRVRELGLQGMNASQTTETRALIASEVRESLEHLLQLANSRDGDDNYLFSGYSSHTKPFSRSGSSFDFNGDQGQRRIQIGQSRQVADGDSGANVFQLIPNGNGSFATAASDANTGTGVIGVGNVTDPSLSFDGPYEILFTDPATVEIRNGSGALLATSPFSNGDTLEFDGVQVRIDGEPAAGDTFDVTASVSQDIFTTLSLMVDSLESGPSDATSRAKFQTEMHSTLVDIDQGIGNMLRTRAKVGARLRVLDQQANANEGFGLILASNLSDLKDLDYAEAVSRLSIQSTALEAAQRSFSRVQGLSLFNYIR